MNTYEAMFLIEPTVAAREWNKVGEEIDRIVKRNGASVLAVNKWGERKLAYPVRKSNRGTYVLAYFSAPGTAVGKIRADFQLSEIVLRFLVTRYEGEELRKEPPKDFETAGTLPLRREPVGDMGDGGFRSGPRF